MEIEVSVGRFVSFVAEVWVCLELFGPNNRELTEEKKRFINGAVGEIKDIVESEEIKEAV